MLYSVSLVVCLYIGSVFANLDVKYHHVKDARLCNNVESSHNAHSCKLRYEPDLEAGETYNCDRRKIAPDQCRVAVIESGHPSLLDAYEVLPTIESDQSVRRIVIKFNSSAQLSVEEVGSRTDNFLKSHMWWYVTKEPYIWSPANTQQVVVLSRVQHYFEPSLRVMSALQFPTQDACKKTPLILHHRDFKHPGWYSMLAQYAHVHRELPYAITGVYVSSANSVNDSTSFISAEDCPDVVNKWECAFLPVTNCSLPRSVTHCTGENCVVSGVRDTIMSSAIFNSASEDATSIEGGSAELNAAKELTKRPLHTNAKLMEALAVQAKSEGAGTQYGKPQHPHQAPFHRMMFSDVDNYGHGLLLRPSALYRSRIADMIHHFQDATGFTSSQRCVAAQIRRGDRAAANLNITAFCLDPANKHSDYGCADVPFASVTLRHVVESAAKLVEASVRSLVVTTDDEAWLDQQRTELKKTHPEWKIYSLKTPNHTHLPRNKVPNPEVSLTKNDPEYMFMRYGAGTQSGVLLHGSIELSRQCEAFVGHFGCGGTMLVYKALCAQSNHREHVCPPAFDVRSISELRVLKE